MTLVPDEIRRELAPLEHVLWSGQPRQGMVLRGSDLFQIPFSVMWCGFALFWEASVARSGNAFFMLWGVPFVAVGLYIVFGRFFVEARQRARTFYAVTGQRVLIVSGVFSRSVKSLDLNGMPALTLSEGRGGRGSIVFGPENGVGAMFGGASSWPGARQLATPRFDLIEDPRRVYEIIRGASAR